MKQAARREDFRPLAVAAPDGLAGWLLWRARLLSDLQLASIALHLRPLLQQARGVLVDVGCGNMPYRHYAPLDVTYRGFDVPAAQQVFGFANPRAEDFDGRKLPLPSDSVDVVLCTEVLEHHPEPATLAAEIYRILRPGGMAILTIPWSARLHFVPDDYARYSPRQLQTFFAAFTSCQVRPRGTDLSAICSKLVVAFLRNVVASSGLRPLAWTRALLLGLLMPATLMMGRASLHGWGGSIDDPLGFTVVAVK